MTVTQAQIDERLKTLEDLLNQIEPLRKRTADIEVELAQAQRDYDRELGPLNAEAVRLEARKMSLRAAIVRRPPPPTTPSPPKPIQPPAVEEIKPGALPPPPPPENPRNARKRKLADHIYYFLGGDQDGVMQVINAVLQDDRHDVGDMLEVLAWGDIWKARADWETLEDQHRRLGEWHSALQDRLNYWQREVRRLEADPRQDLLREMKTRDRESWLAFLKDLGEQQKTENERLAREVRVLDEQWQGKQIEEARDG